MRQRAVPTRTPLLLIRDHNRDLPLDLRAVERGIIHLRLEDAFVTMRTRRGIPAAGLLPRRTPVRTGAGVSIRAAGFGHEAEFDHDLVEQWADHDEVGREDAGRDLDHAPLVDVDEFLGLLAGLRGGDDEGEADGAGHGANAADCQQRGDRDLGRAGQFGLPDHGAGHDHQDQVADDVDDGEDIEQDRGSLLDGVGTFVGETKVGLDLGAGEEADGEVDGSQDNCGYHNCVDDGALDPTVRENVEQEVSDGHLQSHEGENVEDASHLRHP